MVSDRNVELVGASAGPVPIAGAEVHTAVRLDASAKSRMKANLTAFAAVTDRIFLNLENVRSKVDGPALGVYLDLPDGAAAADHPERLAGNIALFGVRKASIADEEYAGSGITFVLEISAIVDQLHLENRLDL